MYTPTHMVTKEYSFENVKVSLLQGQPQIDRLSQFNNGHSYDLVAIDQAEDILLRFFEKTTHFQATSSNNNDFSPITSPLVLSPNHISNGNTRIGLEINVHRETDCFVFHPSHYVINADQQQKLFLLHFVEKKDLNRLSDIINEYKKDLKESTFHSRTDTVSASQYFQFYGYLSQQQNMMQDYIRTSTYQKAILSNCEDFRDKVVLDVGAGSGILSFFAAQAGARKVYAIEASSMAKHAQSLVQTNNCSNIVVLAGKLEEIKLPEPVDVIISEPMGYMLFNERMLETFLHAKKWLKAPGKRTMYPSRGDLHLAPFTDTQLFLEQTNKANFWLANDFHGIDLRALHNAATIETFKQPIVDTFDIRICMAKTIRHVIDFQTAHESELHNVHIPLEFVSNQTGHIHGLAFWFDVAFQGTSHTIWLSTSPSQPLTHWYQVRCLLTTPLFVNKGQTICGSCTLRSNKRQSYDVDIDLYIRELGTRSTNTLDLKNPYFRYSGQPILQPPGVNEMSPSEQLWSTTTYEPCSMIQASTNHKQI